MRLTQRKARFLCTSMLLVSALSMLSACDPHVRLATPPPEYLECATEPAAPDLPAIDWTAPVDQIKPVQRERDIATLGYVLSLRSAWGDCRAKIDGVRAWGEEVG